MKNMNNIENKAFSSGKPETGNKKRVSYPPLSIGARGKENRIKKTAKWTTRRICLFHGEDFHWKGRCRRCRHLISFQMRR